MVLVIFQGLFIAHSLVREHWEIYLACVAGDAVLGAAFLRASWLRRSAQQSRFQQVNEALHWVLEMTSHQQKQWQSTIEALGGMDQEDPISGKKIRDLLVGLSNVKLVPTAKLEKKDSTVETMIDSIQTMVLQHNSLTMDIDTVLRFYRANNERLTAVQSEHHLNHFRLKEAVLFLEMMGTRSNQYSEQLILEVLESFRAITNYSEGISNDVLKRLHELMDARNVDSLDNINQGSHRIQQTMDTFFRDLERANLYSEKAVAENLAQMARVQSMAASIGEFSESIRMIALNLNIEAARVRSGGASSGKGFQVLATKLSEFAVRAQELAQQQHDTIATASSVMTESGKVQVGQLAGLMTEIPKIKGQLDPFEAIIHRTYAQFASVEETMRQLSESISERLKLVVGKFQFQDLVRQEQEHIHALLAYVRDRAEEGAGGFLPLDPVKKMKAWNELLHTFETLASTSNEHAVVQEYRQKNPALSKKEGSSEILKAGSVSLF